MAFQCIFQLLWAWNTRQPGFCKSATINIFSLYNSKEIQAKYILFTYVSDTNSDTNMKT